MRGPEPGMAAAAGLVGWALVVDVVLIRRSCDPISSCVRRSRVARVVTAYLALHLLTRLPHDPLSWLGRRLSHSST